MTIEEDTNRRKESLRFFYQMAQEALDAEDLDQAIEITAKGLEEAELKNQCEWVEKFGALNSQAEKAKGSSSLNTSIAREDISKIKGVGEKVAGKLRDAGFHTIKSIAEATSTQITHIPGIGQKTAQNIIEGANAHISRKSLIDFPKEISTKEEQSVKNESKKITDEMKIEELQELRTPEESNLPWFDERFKIRRLSHSQDTKPDDNEEYLDEDIDADIDYEEIEEDKDGYLGHNINDDIREVGDDITFENPAQKRHVEFSSLQNSNRQTIVNRPRNPSELLRDREFQEKNNRQVIQNETKQDTTFTEKLIPSERNSRIERLIHTLQGLDFHIIRRVAALKGFYKNCDLIALKIIHVNESLDFMLILPIKLNMLKGKIKVSNEQVKYIPINERLKENGSSFRLLLNSTITSLGKLYQAMNDDLVNEGKLLSYVQKQLRQDITIKRSLTKKSLFFHSGSVQYKIFIEPLLICNDNVGFLEKRVLFPYLKDINLHIIEEQKLPDLLLFLQNKYTCIEDQNDQKSSLLSYEDSFNQFIVTGKKLSLPFIGLGSILLLLVVFQVFSVLELVVNIGYALFGVYVTSLAYLYIKFFKTKLELHTDFNTPIHQKRFKMDDTKLILIEDELAPEMMNQFIYECLGKDHKSSFLSKLEESYTREDLERKTTIPPFDSDFIFEGNVNNMDLDKKNKVKKQNSAKIPEEDEFMHKYSSFLED